MFFAPIQSFNPSNMRYDFASDNTAGLCPEALAAIIKANSGFVPSYGNDAYTAQAADAIRAFFGRSRDDCDVFFVFNGTAANSLALASLCQSYHSVIASECAHIETDECGAPEFFSNGSKLLLAQSPQGKINAEALVHLINRRDDIHYPKPKVLSITQPTEYGTVYALDELSQLINIAKSYQLKVHLDGARLVHALVALQCTAAEFIKKVAVDVLCLGGTKQGLGMCEAVVFFNKSLSEEFAYRCKQAGQLSSKMRFMAAPWVALLDEDDSINGANNLALTSPQPRLMRYAAQANQRAKALSEGLLAQNKNAKNHRLKLYHPTQANSVFIEADKEVLDAVAQQWSYYRFIGNAARFVCSWSTDEAQINDLIESFRRAL